MKLLFIHPDVSKSLGVLSKIVSKLNAILEQPETIQIEAIFFGNKIDTKAYSGLNCRVSFVRIDTGSSQFMLLNQKIFWSIKYENELRRKFDTLTRVIGKIDADFLIMRDFAMSKSGVAFLKRCQSKFKVVLESNTNISSELNMKANKHGAWYNMEARKELQYRRKSLKFVNGIIAVTVELENLYLALGFDKQKIRVITNGVKVKKITDQRYKWNPNEALRCVFLAGTSSEWNGIDRLENSLKSYRGKTKLIVDVYGISSERLDGPNFELNFVDRVNPQDISTRLSNYHIGISTLALYKKNMEEACTLKVREYLASGLPVLLAYNDTDLDEESSFVFRVNNNDSRIDFENVVEWYYNLANTVAISQLTNEFAFRKLTYQQKSWEICNFLYTISD